MKHIVGYLTKHFNSVWEKTKTVNLQSDFGGHAQE